MLVSDRFVWFDDTLVLEEALEKSDDDPGPEYLYTMDLPEGATLLGTLRKGSDEVEKFDPDQPRDDAGKWTVGGSSGVPASGGTGRPSGTTGMTGLWGKGKMTPSLAKLPSAVHPVTGEVDVKQLLHNGNAVDVRAAHHASTEPSRDREKELDKLIPTALKDLQDVTAKWHDANDRWFGSNQTDLQAKADSDRWSAEMDVKAKELADYHNERDGLIRNPVGRAAWLDATSKVLGLTAKDNLNPDLVGLDPAAVGGSREKFEREGLTRSAREGSDFVSRLVGDGGLGHGWSKPELSHPVFVVKAETDPSRSSCSGNRISLTPGDRTWVAVHELGHALENGRNDVSNMATTFLEHRYNTSTDPKLQRIAMLRDLSGNPAYKEDEIGFKDKFKDLYAGKVYTNRIGKTDYIVSTELISMGLQKLYENPHEFRRSDPEFYKFTLGVAHHVVAHKSDLGSSNAKAPAWAQNAQARAAGTKP